MSGRTKSSSLQNVDLSSWSFALWWLMFFVVHVVAGGYNAAYAMFYWKLKYSYLYQCLEYSGIGMRTENHNVIAVVKSYSDCDAWGGILPEPVSSRGSPLSRCLTIDSPLDYDQLKFIPKFGVDKVYRG
ncbi:hypothetical protein JG687_00002915 [Phytophthora cactorum]|uniref:Uncharacterized protein n=1 Tax=Phytophthora cactorum TaxID=29920 RepID=A0A8T1UT28_9STRA|nr:hypothetical protein GQ600_2735 [Phytophthora cactorum]KAG6969950.1 hypothetical protein JG687_00002915 [Phytophthora cactorum]